MTGTNLTLRQFGGLIHSFPTLKPIAFPDPFPLVRKKGFFLGSRESELWASERRHLRASALQGFWARFSTAGFWGCRVAVGDQMSGDPVYQAQA